MLRAALFFVASFLNANESINLIWISGDPAISWEEDWIHEMLSEVQTDIHTIVDLNHEVFLDKSIIVTSAPNKEKYRHYFSEYKKRGLKFGVIHLSDEIYDHPCDFYDDPLFIIRNYWHKKFANSKNVSFLALGYKRKFWDGFQGEIKNANDRKYNWVFAGQIEKFTRVSMINNMRKIPHYHIHETFDFNSPDALSATDYRDLLLESIFVPCPRGWWNLDSFRLSEALECGCIPIVENAPFDYFSKIFGKSYPFPCLRSWNEVPKVLRPLFFHPERIEKLRQDCYQWWQNYKAETKKQIADLIQRNFELKKNESNKNQ